MKRLLPFLLLAALPCSAQSITRTQCVGAADATNNNLTVTTSATSVGQLIVLFASTAGNSVSTFTISDNGSGGSNTYTPVSGFANVDLTGGQHSETDWFGYTVAAHGGVTTITAAHNAAGSSDFISVCVYSSSNGWPANPVDQIKAGTYTTTASSFSSGATSTLSQASEAAIGFMQIASDPSTVTPSGGFTQRDLSAFVDSRRHFLSDQIVSATTALTLSATTGASVDAAANVVTFKDNAGGGGGGSTPPARIPQAPVQKPALVQTPGALQVPRAIQIPK
jgi:hypothetical protein